MVLDIVTADSMDYARYRYDFLCKALALSINLLCQQKRARIYDSLI